MQFLWDERPASVGAALAQHTDLVPNMNIVRNEGAVFTQAGVAGPKCAPSRFNVLTGRYCSRGEHSKSSPRFIATEGDDTRSNVDVPSCKFAGADLTSNLPTELAANGYATIMAGKWHLSTTATYVARGCGSGSAEQRSTPFSSRTTQHTILIPPP